MYSSHLVENEHFKEYCLDKMFTEKEDKTIKEFIEANSWEEFRQKETQMFIDTIFKGTRFIT